MPAPEDATVYGIGWAILKGKDVVAGLRALCILTSAEHWLVAETTLVVGERVCGAGNGSHRERGAQTPLQQGRVTCLTERESGEAAGVLAAGSILGMLARSDHPALLLRAGLRAALIAGTGESWGGMRAAVSAQGLGELWGGRQRAQLQALRAPRQHTRPDRGRGRA